MNVEKVSDKLQRSWGEPLPPSAGSCVEIPIHTVRLLRRNNITVIADVVYAVLSLQIVNCISWFIFCLATFGGHRNKFPTACEKRTLPRSVPAQYTEVWITGYYKILCDIIFGSNIKRLEKQRIANEFVSSDPFLYGLNRQICGQNRDIGKEIPSVAARKMMQL